jgi:two-component system, OmpR family, alkaline phosphatase synthesis response regulator PhoP
MTAKILIIDDEVHIRMLIAQTLEELEDQGVELLMATNGEAGLETIRNEHPRMVFLDVMMPKMNGFDVCQAVKREPALADVYIVMLTAKGQDVDRRSGQDAGADLYITKPFDPDELLKRTVQVLGLELG